MAPIIPPTPHPGEGAPAPTPGTTTDTTPPARIADAADGFHPARTRTGDAVHAVYRATPTAWCGVTPTAEALPADTPVTCTRCAVATVEAAPPAPATGDPTPDEAAFLAELTGPAPDRFTPSAAEVAKAKFDILSHVIPGVFGPADVANAMLAGLAVTLAGDVERGYDPAPTIRRIRALEAARLAVAPVAVAR